MSRNSKIKLLSISLLALFLFIQCKRGSDKSENAAAAFVPTPDANPGWDTIIRQLKNGRDLTKKQVLSLGLIDTTYSKTSTETAYCDTTVQLNDSLFYSILTLSEEGGNCSHTFVLTIDEKNKKAIASAYLKPDCDIDYSWDSYDLFEYQLLSKDTLQLSKTTIFQKKKRTSDDEEKNIDHRQTEISYYIIQPSGQIRTAKK